MRPTFRFALLVAIVAATTVQGIGATMLLVVAFRSEWIPYGALSYLCFAAVGAVASFASFGPLGPPHERLIFLWSTAGALTGYFAGLLVMSNKWISQPFFQLVGSSIVILGVFAAGFVIKRGRKNVET